MITIDFQRLGIRPGDRILDIGCGSGRHTAEAYRYPGVIVIGADLDYGDVLETKNRLLLHERLQAHGGGHWWLAVVDITCMPFKANSFDHVICSEVLEHIRNHQAAVEEVVRVLKPGRPLAVSVPRLWPERLCWALSKEYAHADRGHLRIYRKQDLLHRLQSAGLKQFAVHYAHSLHTPYWWLKCLVGPAKEDNPLVNLYHRFLTWDMMKKPRLTRLVDRLLNPVMGKSIVIYCIKKR